MRLSELIERLRDARGEHGDIEVGLADGTYLVIPEAYTGDALRVDPDGPRGPTLVLDMTASGEVYEYDEAAAGYVRSDGS